MEKRHMNQQLARERAVYDYLEALENGDLDGLLDALRQAEYDPSLDQMLVDAHHAYFRDEQTQSSSLAESALRTDPSAQRPASAPVQAKRQRRRGSPRWARALAAVLLVGVLVGSFVTLLMWHRVASNARKLPTSSPTSSACTAFKAYPAPSPGIMSDLLVAVTAVSPQSAWAVGYTVISQPSITPTRTFTEYWNGQSWQIMASPNGATGNGILNAVAAVSAQDVWAVGSYQAKTGGTAYTRDRTLTLIEHWNGITWNVVPSPNSPDSLGPNSPAGNGALNAIAVVSANDIWAAGQAVKSSDGNVQLPLIEHWDGKQWSVVTNFPDTGSIALNGLAVISARDIWVAGSSFTLTNNQQGLIAHWNGSQWKLFSTFADVNTFTQLSVSADDDIWAIGISRSLSPQVEHWDGNKWSVVPLPQLAPSATVLLSGITAVTANDVWAVGYLRVNGQKEQFLVLHWNGKTWQRVKTQVSQPQANNEANAIATDSNQIWIVGDTEGHTALIQGCP